MDLDRNAVDLLQQIFDVLRTSTIAEERGKDPTSRFWAAYKKVSGEYDDDMLERCNGNMDIVLIFAGLFSAANTAFIIAMQPNPIDTTNALLVQLIQITLNGPSAVQPMIISSGYSSSDFWMQALAYASLAFSLLAAFGAVMGKQWLGYYKTNRYVRGSLEERCKQRHQKFQGLEKWYFENVLETFPDLLKFSLFLFGLSLGAAMWSQQQTISVLIITSTACGALSYIVAVVAAVIYADCPFQTRISSVIRRTITSPRLQQIQTRISSVVRQTIISPHLQQILTYISSVTRTTIFPRLQHDDASPDLQRDGPSPDPRQEISTLSAIEWILKTSTNPDVVGSALELLPSLPSNTSVDLVSLSERVRDVFRACFDLDGNVILKDSALAYGKALTYISYTYPNETADIREGSMDWNIWVSWHSLYLPLALQQCGISYRRMVNAREDAKATEEQRYQADTRSALRMAVSARLDRFACPDDIDLVWDDKLHWASHQYQISYIGTSDGYQWTMDCVDHFCRIEDARAAGDALLLFWDYSEYPWPLLSSIQNHSALFLNSTSSDPELFRLRHIALRAVSRFLGPRRSPFLGTSSSSLDTSFLHAVLNSICPSPPSDCTIRSKDDITDAQFADAIDLLNFTKWPEGSDLKTFPLSEIQFLILHILPTPNVDNPERYASYCNALARCMDAGRLRDIALNIAGTMRRDLVESLARVDAVRDLISCDGLSQALLTIFYPHGKDNSYTNYDLHFLRFIFALAKRYGSELSWHHLIGRYNEIMAHTCPPDYDYHQSSSMRIFYLAGILIRIQECAPHFHGDTNRRWNLTMGAWYALDGCGYLDEYVIDALRALVMGTSVYMLSDASRDDLEVLCKWVGNTLDRLKSEGWIPSDIVSSVGDLKDKVCCRLEALGQKA